MPAYGEGCAPTTGAMFTKDATDKNYLCQMLRHSSITDIPRYFLKVKAGKYGVV